MDFITGLPKSRGYSIIMVVVDRLSKYGHFVALKPPITTRLVAELFAREVVRFHGIPRSLVAIVIQSLLVHFGRSYLYFCVLS